MSEHKMTIGSRAQVWHGTAHHTAGGLTKKHLKKNKHGRIVSKKKSTLGKTKGLKRLKAAGYHTKKGTFGAIKKDVKNKSKKNKK
jgi:hypothetical protein|tara:strand:- start:2945 stop:3199 length:255 start_codon:yes stop_codon:yes gene_type:complete